MTLSLESEAQYLLPVVDKDVCDKWTETVLLPVLRQSL